MSQYGGRSRQFNAFTLKTNLNQLLERIGLDPAESRVYLFVLEHGEQAASKIAEQVGLPRSTTRGVLDKLCQRGLLTKLYKQNTQYYSCLSPERLSFYVKDEIKTKQSLLSEFEQLMPTLIALHSQPGIVPKVRLFEGKDQVIEAFNLSLFDDLTSELLIFTSYQFLHDPIIRKNDDDFFIKMRVEKGIPARVLVGKTKESTKMIKKCPAELRERRFIPEKYELPGNIHIYGDSVLYFSTKPNEYMAVLVEGVMMAQTLRTLFEYMWEGCKE